MASCGADGAVKLWSLDSDEPIADIEGQYGVWTLPSLVKFLLYVEFLVYMTQSLHNVHIYSICLLMRKVTYTFQKLKKKFFIGPIIFCLF
jgi:hypothetical protein